MSAKKKKALGRGVTEVVPDSSFSMMQRLVTSHTAPDKAAESECDPTHPSISRLSSPSPTDATTGLPSPEAASMSSGKGGEPGKSDRKDAAQDAASFTEGVTLDEAASLGQGDGIEAVRYVGNDTSQDAAGAEEEHRLSTASAGVVVDPSPPQAPMTASVPASAGQDSRTSDEGRSAQTFWAFG